MKIGAQMFTIRDFCQTPEGTVESLEKLAKIGYRYVQYSGCGPMDPHELRAACDRLGIEIVITHSPYDRIVNDTDRLIEEHDILGCDYIGLGMMPKEDREDLAGLNKFLKEIKEPAKKITAAGKRFGYHNHALEFKKLDGKLIFDRILEALPAGELGVILDTYWVQRGGADIYQWIEKMRGRLTCVHLKDFGVMEDGSSAKMAPVGEGNLNFPKILAAFEEAGAQYAFVEQDRCYEEDPFDCLERSLCYLQSLGY